MGDSRAANGPGVGDVARTGATTASAASSPVMARRTALALGLAGLSSSLLTGCSLSDPRVDSPSATSTPSPTSTPSAAATTDPAADELALATWADAVRTGPHRAGLPAAQRRVLQTLAAVHRRHATALAAPRPGTDPSPTAGASATPAPSPTLSPAPLPTGFARLSLAQSVERLRRDELAQSSRLHASALVSTGSDALLLGSVSVSDGACATALTTGAAASTSTPGTPEAVAAVSDVEAVQSMVRQLHAVVYGYQLALGHLEESSPAGQRALASLREHRALRDRLEAVLVSRSASVPVAYAAYVPPVQPSTAARSGRLIRLLETALQPFCGQWLASATTSADRASALSALTSAVVTARADGAALPVWPGWQLHA